MNTETAEKQPPYQRPVKSSSSCCLRGAAIPLHPAHTVTESSGMWCFALGFFFPFLACLGKCDSRLGRFICVRFPFTTGSVLLLRLSRMRSLAGFLFYSTFGFTFPPASTSGVAQSHGSLIRCRGALAKLIPPRFGPSEWMLHVCAGTPGTVRNGVKCRGSCRVVEASRAKAFSLPTPHCRCACVVRKDAGR